MIENFKLKVFRVVADTLNFRRAVDQFQITQPAVTARVKSLEESLGIALFDRFGRRPALRPPEPRYCNMDESPRSTT